MTKPRTAMQKNADKCRPISGIEAVRLEYVHGSESVEALAEKHSVMPKTALSACTRGGWADERKAFRDKVRSEVAAEALEETKQRERETRDAHYKVASLARNKVARALMAMSDDPKASELRDATTAGLTTYKWAALALGLSTENKHVSGESVIEIIWPTQPKPSGGE